MSQQVSTAVFNGCQQQCYVVYPSQQSRTFLTLLLMQIMHTFLTLFMQTFRHEPSVYYITNRCRQLCTNYCIFQKITLFIYDLIQTTVHEL